MSGQLCAIAKRRMQKEDETCCVGTTSETEGAVANLYPSWFINQAGRWRRR